MAPSSIALRAQGVTKRFGDQTVLQPTDLELGAGESLAIFGTNGAGKTTLLKCLALAHRYSAGTLELFGHDAEGSPATLRRKIGFLSHHLQLYESWSIQKNLRFFAQFYGVPIEPSVTAALERFDLLHRKDDPVGQLSRGLQQRASLARGLIHDPEAVFLDEPFTGLDPTAANMLDVVLRDLQQGGKMVAFSTHRIARGLALSTRWILLRRGHVVAHGDSSTTDAATLELEHFKGVRP